MKRFGRRSRIVLLAVAFVGFMPATSAHAAGSGAVDAFVTFETPRAFSFEGDQDEIRYAVASAHEPIEIEVFAGDADTGDPVSGDLSIVEAGTTLASGPLD